MNCPYRPANLLATVLCFLTLCLPVTEPASASQLDPDELINLELKRADLVETLKSFAQISGSTLDIDPSIRGQVTISMKAARWTDVLSQICLDQGLNCEILEAEPPVMRVRATAESHGAAAVPGYVEAISLVLKDADLRQTLQAFAVITQRDVVIDDAVSGKVTINIGAAPWTVILEEICNLSGCAITWGQTLQIRPAAQTSDARRVDLQLAEASIEKAVNALASLPIFGPLGQPEVQLANDLTGRVSVDLRRANWLEAMNGFCESADCVWQLTYGAPTQLEVQARDRSPEREVELPEATMPLSRAAELLAERLELTLEIRPGFDAEAEVRLPASPVVWREAAKDVCHQADCVWTVHEGQLTISPRVKVLQQQPSAGARDRTLAVHFLTPTASLPIEGALRFNWTAPTHTLTSAVSTSDLAEDGEYWMARLSWVPFNPELHLVVPTLAHCSSTGEAVEMLEPVRVPLAEATSRQWRGASVELSELVGEASPSSETRGGDNCAGSPSGAIEVTFYRANDAGESGVRERRAISDTALESRIGNTLMVTPPNVRHPASMAALIALGASPGGQRLALLRATDDGTGVSVEQLEIPATGEITASLSAPDGSTYELALRFMPKP
ncbi:MAG: hypothetical protein AAF560_31290 [Acidobacteriota bacterium]